MNSQERKQEIDDLQKSIFDAQRRIRELIKDCHHEFRPLKESELNDKWMSVGARCVICREHFGWRCKKSPDGVCHYFSDKKGEHHGYEVSLITGITHILPRDHNPEYETPDTCLFCGMPDERK